MMARIQVTTAVEAEPGDLWAYVRDIGTHVEWMADAESITFLTEQRSGVGTRFECETRVGPLRTTDVMEIVSWEDGARMGVRHEGLVTGEGAFTLQPAGEGRTEFRWTEDLDLPLWMVPPVAERVLAWVWRRNLRALKARVEAR